MRVFFKVAVDNMACFISQAQAYFQISRGKFQQLLLFAADGSASDTDKFQLLFLLQIMQCDRY